MAEGVELYQIYYKDEQRQHLFPFSKPYFNEGLTIFFESEVISRLVKASEAEKVGVCSWKLNQKLKNRVAGPTRRQPLTQEALNNGYDVLSFTRNTPAHRMISRATVWHPKFLPAIDLLWQKLGIKRPHDTRSPIYQNHYVARTDIYKDYVVNFLDPAMELIKTDQQLNEIMMSPANYESLVNPPVEIIERLKQFLGIDYYPMCPFVLERCPALYFEMKKIKVSYL